MLANYHFVSLILVTIFLYSTSFALSKNKKISLASHKKIWNYILLLTFVVSGILGLILAMLIDFNYSISWYRQILWIHVEFGICMAIISVFHIIWHLKYFLDIKSIRKRVMCN